jgi:2-aminoadipate transaminase
MEYRFSKRSSRVEDSFIVEIFKYLQDKEMISFSGGFPNPDSFPVEQLKQASNKVFDLDGKSILQYSQTEGYKPLRQFISNRYKQIYNLDIPYDEILITSGSQQALDFIAKSFLDPNDTVIVEEPSYLGALQTFASYEADFLTVQLNENGIDCESLEQKLIQYNPKLIYIIPNFQNPSGVSYSEENRIRFSEIVKRFNVIVIEDDPYGELYFTDSKRTHLKSLLPNQVLLMGSFSKTISPGLRLGWVCAPKAIYKKLFTCKEASDLHSSYLDQRIIYQYLIDNNYDDHLSHIRMLYRSKQKLMLSAISKYFPENVKVFPSSGGMFLWVVLPEDISSLNLFYEAVKEKVVFVPGDPFYVNKQNTNAFRLNFSNASNENIEEGIKRLGHVIKQKIK